MKSFYCKCFLRIFFLLNLAAVGLVWQCRTVEAQDRPLTYPEIITALNSKVPNSVFKNKFEVIYLVKQVNIRRVDRELTPDLEKLLWQSGASDQLIKAIKVKAPNSSKSNLTRTFSKTYQEMSESEKREFIEVKTNEFLDKFGRTAADKIPAKGLDLIKSFLDSYVKRLTIDEEAIDEGNAEGMISKNSCLYAKGNLANILKRGGSHSPNIIDSFVNKGVQPELGIYIAFMESEFCPCLQAPTGPLGMFQLTYFTASTFGIKAVRGASPESPDERCNPKAAALGAASYIKSMSDKFYGKDVKGLLFLVAAYNSGEGLLNRNISTVRQSNNGKGTVTFWDLLENSSKLTQQFQSENVKYVPKFLAAAIIGENPKAFGLVEFEPLSGNKANRTLNTSTVNNELEFWQKQNEKARQPRNKPTGENPAGLKIPNELTGILAKQNAALNQMKSEGFAAPMDYFDLAGKNLSGEVVEIPLVTETYLLDIGGSATEDEFTKFSFEGGAAIPASNSSEYKNLEKFAVSYKYDLNNPSDRRKVRIRLLRMLHPKAKAVLEEIARKYHAKFARPLRVTSLIRSMDYQLALNNVNANSFLVRKDGMIPPHCSGLAFDFGYKQMTAEEQNFLLGVVAEMEKNGRVDGVREGGVNAALHVFVLE